MSKDKGNTSMPRMASITLHFDLDEWEEEHGAPLTFSRLNELALDFNEFAAPIMGYNGWSTSHPKPSACMGVVTSDGVITHDGATCPVHENGVRQHL